MAVLRTYVEKNNMGTFSDAEYEDILRALPKEPFEQTEYSFKTNVSNKIKDLAYSKKVRQLLITWKTKTGFDNASVWSMQNIMPIVWVMPEMESLFSVVLAIEKNERIDDIRLENALVDVNEHDFSILTDQAEINRCFVMNVASEKYLSLLLPHVNEIKEKIQNSGCRDYYRWNSELIKIRPIVEKYITTDLKSEVSDKAKKRIRAINDLDQLKKELERVLDQSSEACLLLLEEK